MLFIIGGKSNNTDILRDLPGMGDALREHFSRQRADAALRRRRSRRPEPCARLGRLAETCRVARAPYRFFGFDSAISEVVNYAKKIDEWMKRGGRTEIAAKLGIKQAA